MMTWKLEYPNVLKRDYLNKALQQKFPQKAHLSNKVIIFLIAKILSLSDTVKVIERLSSFAGEG
jgi:hypothetical protein